MPIPSGHCHCHCHCHSPLKPSTMAVVLAPSTFLTPTKKKPNSISAIHLPSSNNPINNKNKTSILKNSGAILTIVALLSNGDASANEIPLLGFEPDNALSLPTWAIHVSSVVEWIIAMILVWEYGERPGYESWKGLSWGMVPLLGGAFCACTWHFFYNAESLSVLVALQGALTVIGNFTMCIAAYRIYKSSQGGAGNP